MQRKGGKSDGGEKRHCVDLVATLTDLPPPSLTLPPPSLFLVLSFFPPVLPGIKTSIHAPEETHSRGEKRGRKKGEERGGGRQGGTVCGSLGSGPLSKVVCMCVSACLFSLSMCCLSQCFTISDLVASVPAKASSGKVGWESLEIGLNSNLPLLD